MAQNAHEINQTKYLRNEYKNKGHGLLMQEHLSMSRRNIFHLGAGAAFLGMSGCAKNPAPQLNVKALTPEDAFQAYIKTIGSVETSDIYIWFKGILWGAIPRQLPVAFCEFQGLARHRWTANSDGSFTQKAYDVGFFGDLETGRPTEFITNPLTQEKIKTYHNKYGGFEQIHRFDDFAKREKDQSKAKLDWYSVGDQLVLTERSTGQIKSKMQPETWPRESSGPINYYGGETSYALSLDHLSNSQIKAAPYTMFWSSFSPWEPWLFMDGAPGICQWRATGVKLKSYTDAPQDMLDFVKLDQPNYFEPDDPWEGYLSNTDRYMKDRAPA